MSVHTRTCRYGKGEEKVGERERERERKGGGGGRDRQTDRHVQRLRMVEERDSVSHLTLRSIILPQ